MKYYEINIEVLSSLFGLAVSCLFEARVPEFETQPLPPPPPSSCWLYSVHYLLNIASNTGNPEPEFLNISWGLKRQLLPWKDIFLSIPAFSGFLNIQAVFLEGWLLRAAVSKMVGGLRISLEKSTFPKAVFSTATLKCWRIWAQSLNS